VAPNLSERDVETVHTLASDEVVYWPDSLGFGMFFGSSQCLQGLERSSSPSSGCRGAFSSVECGGFKSVAGEPSACCELGVFRSSFRFCQVGRGRPTPIPGSGLRAQHDVADSGG
jgi:hypothetical protein